MFVYKRTGEEVPMTANRDVWMDDELLKVRKKEKESESDIIREMMGEKKGRK